MRGTNNLLAGLAAAGLVAAGLLLGWCGAAADQAEGGPADRGAAGDRGVVEPVSQGRRGPNRRADGDPVPAAEPVEVVVDESRGVLVRADLLARAGARTPFRVDASAAAGTGLRCPDGTRLPLLNGVEAAPPLLREPSLGPVPPVVALLVDADGWEWYEHADGSITTTRPQWVTDAAGSRAVQVVTVHNAPGGAGGAGPARLETSGNPQRR